MENMTLHVFSDCLAVESFCLETSPSLILTLLLRGLRGEILQPMAVPWGQIPFVTCCTCHNLVAWGGPALGVVCHHYPFVIPLVIPLIFLYTYKKWLPACLVCHLFTNKVESSTPLNNTEQCGQYRQMNNLFIKQRKWFPCGFTHFIALHFLQHQTKSKWFSNKTDMSKETQSSKHFEYTGTIKNDHCGVDINIFCSDMLWHLCMSVWPI